MNFIDSLKNTLNGSMNVSMTENGAIGYKTTGKDLLDLHFSVASLRSATDYEIMQKFIKAYFDNRQLALKWLFYARDIRGGLGERRLFRVIIENLARTHREINVEQMIELIPQYGRFDDLYVLVEAGYKAQVVEFIKATLSQDILNKEQGEGISLLAKWLPSVNTSSEKSRKLARMFAKELGMSEKDYRKTLSSLRKYIDVVEVKMSANEFNEINYETVPSKANLIYRKAFLRQDEGRRNAYLERLKEGNAKINSGVLFPYEIVHAYAQSYQIKAYDEALEQMWKALPDTVQGGGNSIVVADGSGSMTVPVGEGRCTALSVANALAIYFAERSCGQFKNKYITFSMNPQLVDLSKGKSLKEKLEIARAHNEVANTDIYKVFELILKTAVKGKLAASELPANIIIVSDMEFDSCAVNGEANLFEQIAKRYKGYGYKLPRLVFWNVNSRTNTIPVKDNESGVALVSGFSTNVFNMVLSGQLDAYKCLTDILDGERYEPVAKLIAG
ncbi:DUF2828 family protein [Tyzzerella sp. OttesenSCG-928-J15]|nr:DUF2828 family protein [Tyzzerella sp. OttesenSCG-928-J15]